MSTSTSTPRAAPSPFALPTERDACGIGFVARVDGIPSREVARRASTGAATAVTG
jgi:hypothetical protein